MSTFALSWWRNLYILPPTFNVNVTRRVSADKCWHVTFPKLTCGWDAPTETSISRRDNAGRPGRVLRHQTSQTPPDYPAPGQTSPPPGGAILPNKPLTASASPYPIRSVVSGPTGLTLTSEASYVQFLLNT